MWFKLPTTARRVRASGSRPTNAKASESKWQWGSLRPGDHREEKPFVGENRPPRRGDEETAAPPPPARKKPHPALSRVPAIGTCRRSTGSVADGAAPSQRQRLGERAHIRASASRAGPQGGRRQLGPRPASCAHPVPTAHAAPRALAHAHALHVHSRPAEKRSRTQSPESLRGAARRLLGSGVPALAPRAWGARGSALRLPAEGPRRRRLLRALSPPFPLQPGRSHARGRHPEDR